jgi:hypothetical protein
MIKWDSSLGCKNGSMVCHMQINKCDTSYQQSKWQKAYDISTDAEKTFDQIQHSFVIKMLKALHTEATHITKAIYIKPTEWR